MGMRHEFERIRTAYRQTDRDEAARIAACEEIFALALAEAQRRWGRPRYGAEVERLRRDVIWYIDGQCRWPGCTERGLELDHKHPRAEGGTNEIANRQPLCLRHHREKTATDRDHAWHAAGRRLGLEPEEER